MTAQDPTFPEIELPEKQIYTVSELNDEAKHVIEGSFPLIWVEGEISNLARPASGHMYFSLKDEAAQVRCAMFRMRNRLVNFQPKNGIQVIVRAQVGFYEARGEFQLIVEHMEEAGAGALRRKFEALKTKLAEEGLFEAERKRELPVIPQRAGIITSATGAALRDILSVIQRRFPSLPLLIYPVPVQGEAAAAQISAMIKTANQRQECDVLILARGGGSLEDLWSFNEESVARAIADSHIPLVCGVGHETDFSIADFVADVRAPTPSAAAELITPNAVQWLDRLAGYEVRLCSQIQQRLMQHNQQLSWLMKRLVHPKQRIQTQAQRIDELERRLINAQKRILQYQSIQLTNLNSTLIQQSPLRGLREQELRHQNLIKRLKLVINHKLAYCQQSLSTKIRALDTVSPLSTLSRGYSILRTANNKIIRKSAQVRVGEEVNARLAHGQLTCTVKEIINQD